ncbi:hypothetical protein CRG98_037762 [Punica granatum]|uniref:Uncharacterized protein n=1 Tax=Punica granatum TaxID=22663 RepID=A0A2I0ICZ0_PUNGR|nr:hypothetical protein CRG98_037762 [Punica granatum]
MDAREKESPLTILRPKGRGSVNYPGLGVWNTPIDESIKSDQEPEREVGLHVEESVRYLRITVRRTAVVDSLRESRPQIFGLACL